MQILSDWHTSTIATLRKNEWFSQFTHETLIRLTCSSRLLKLQSGEELVKNGDLAQTLGIVLKGTLHASLTNAAGKRHIVGYYGPIQIVNIIPILDDQCSVHDIIAHNEASVLSIPKQVFLDTLESDHTMARAIMRLLCLRSRTLYENTSDNALRTLRARCARMLLLLMSSHGETENIPVNIMLKISQDEFADMIGCTRQSINPELKQLEREGIIQMKYSRFLIYDPNALRRIVTSEVIN